MVYSILNFKTLLLFCLFAKISITTKYYPNYERDDQNAGNYGGMCTCPNGQEHWVGDEKNGCKSLSCQGGTMNTCFKHKGRWSKKSVVCGLEDKSEKVEKLQEDLVDLIKNYSTEMKQMNEMISTLMNQMQDARSTADAKDISLQRAEIQIINLEENYAELQKKREEDRKIMEQQKKLNDEYTEKLKVNEKLIKDFQMREEVREKAMKSMAKERSTNQENYFEQQKSTKQQ
jgi:hypothetical protein